MINLSRYYTAKHKGYGNHNWAVFPKFPNSVSGRAPVITGQTEERADEMAREQEKSDLESKRGVFYEQLNQL